MKIFIKIICLLITCLICITAIADEGKIVFENTNLDGGKIIVLKEDMRESQFEKDVEKSQKDFANSQLIFRVPQGAAIYSIYYSSMEKSGVALDKIVSYRYDDKYGKGDGGFRILDVNYNKNTNIVYTLIGKYELVFVRSFNVKTNKLDSGIFYNSLSNPSIISGEIKSVAKDGKLKIRLVTNSQEEFEFEGSPSQMVETPRSLVLKEERRQREAQVSPNILPTEQDVITKIPERSPYDEQTIWSKEIVDAPVMGTGAFVSRQRFDQAPIEDALHDLLPGEELPPTKVIDRYIWKTSTWSDTDGWIIPELWMQEVEVDEKNPVIIEVLDMNYKLGSPVLSTIYKKAGRIYANVIRTNEQGQPLTMAGSDMLLPLGGDELNVTSAVLEGSIESPKMVLSYAGGKKITFVFKEGKWARVAP